MGLSFQKSGPCCCSRSERRGLQYTQTGLSTNVNASPLSTPPSKAVRGFPNIPHPFTHVPTPQPTPQEGCQYRLLCALQSAGEARCIPVVVDRHACNPRKWTAIVRNALSHRLYVPLFADAPASERSAALRAIVSEVRRAAPELPRWPPPGVPPTSSTLPSRATAASPAANDAVVGLASLLHTSAIAAENEAVLHVRPGTAVSSVSSSSSSPSPNCDDGITPLVLPEPARAHTADDTATTTAAECSQPTPLPSAAASPRRNVVVGLRSLPPSPLPTFAPRRPSPNSAASGQDTSGAAALFDTRSVEDWLKAETWEGDQQAAGKPFLMDWVASRRKWLFMQPEGTPLIVRADGSLADHPTSHSQDAIAGIHTRHRLLAQDCRKLERRRLDGSGSGGSMRAALYDGAADMACPSDEDADPEANHRRGFISAATPAHNPVEAMAGQTCGNGADAGSDTLDAQTIGFNHKDVGDVVAVLYSQARSAAAVTRACLALRDLTVEDDHARVEVARRGGLEAIVLRMREHLTHPRLLENACRAFINLAVNDDNELTIVARGGVDAIVMAMRAFPDDCALQTQGCWSLRNLAFNPLNKRAVAGRGGLDAVLKAMRNHAHRHDGCEVQEHGCWAIRNLSADDNNKAAIAASGGIETTLDAMRLHHDRAAVQKQGCGALANLGANPANRIAIGRLRGVETIVVALRTHLSNAEVQVQGGWAIKNLAYNGPENRAAVARLNGIEAIKDAIRVHSSHPGVVEQCARALWNLSYENEENQAAILADDGRRLLEAAKATHASRPSVVEAVVGALNNLNTATAARAS